MRWMFILVLTLSSAVQYPIQVLAQTQKPVPTKRPIRFEAPKPPSGIGTPSGRRAGMGSRDNCPAVETALTALVPSQKLQTQQSSTSVSEIVGGLTTSSRPTFWFYVPYTSSLKSALAEFTLQDGEGNDVYQSTIALPPKPGIISVTPSNAGLETDKPYRWYFQIRCTQQQVASVPIFVEGDIRRVNLNPSVVSQLQAATPQQKAAIYAANGIWFDSIHILAQLRSSNEADWQSLLQSAGLGNVSNFPILQPVAN